MIEIFQIAGFVLFNAAILSLAAAAIFQKSARQPVATVPGIAGAGISDRRMMPAAADRRPSRPSRTGVRANTRSNRTAR